MITVTKEAFDNFIRNKAATKREDWNHIDYFDEQGNLVAHSWGQANFMPEENYQIAVKSNNEVTSFLVGGIIDIKTK